MDVYGFKRPSNFDKRYYDDFMQSYCKVLERRSNRWKAKVMNGGGGHTMTHLSRSRTLKRFCRKGMVYSFFSTNYSLLGDFSNMK